MNRKNIIIISIVIALVLMVSVNTISYAKEIYNFAVSASVPPHYQVTANGDVLSIQTNMKLIINGKEITY